MRGEVKHEDAIAIMMARIILGYTWARDISLIWDLIGRFDWLTTERLHSPI